MMARRLATFCLLMATGTAQAMPVPDPDWKPFYPSALTPIPDEITVTTLRAISRDLDPVKIEAILGATPPPALVGTIHGDCLEYRFRHGETDHLGDIVLLRDCRSGLRSVMAYTHDHYILEQDNKGTLFCHPFIGPVWTQSNGFDNCPEKPK